MTRDLREDAAELVLPESDPQDKVLDMLARPEHYAGIVSRIRRHLAAKYSYEARIHELVGLMSN